jgi:GT2 family glycosyltransferase
MARVDVPFVKIVVLNYDGGAMTEACLDSLRDLDWPHDRYQVVLIDNGSVDGLARRIPTQYPEVLLVESIENLGFAGGCNLGIRSGPEADYVALLNNDALASPNWLAPLAAALEAEPDLGAACPKMLFDGRFVGVRITTTASPSGRPGDQRPLGVRLSGMEIDGSDVPLASISLDEGFWGVEGGDHREPWVAWTQTRGEARVELAEGDPTPGKIAIRLAALGPREAVLDSGVDRQVVEVGTEPTWFTLQLPAEPFSVINNVGSALYVGGYGGDRGFLERDEGQYEEAVDVFAWCGGAVLLRQSYLDHVGLFDERFFLYYEDTDLSWRGRRLGWRYRYVPDSVIRHHHAVSSGGASSPMFRYYTQRNRMLVLAKNAPWKVAARAAAVEARITLSVLTRDVVRPMATAHFPRFAEARQRLRSHFDALRLAPSMWRDRRELRRRETVSARQLMSWTVRK